MTQVEEMNQGIRDAIAERTGAIAFAGRQPIDRAEQPAAETRITSDTGGQKGQKLARFDLIDWRFLWKLAEVCGFGAKKYSDDNWRKGYDWRLSYGAMQRHAAAFWNGENNDPESGLHHLAHVGWHAMVLFTFSTVAKYARFDTRPVTQEASNDSGAMLGCSADEDS